MTDLERRALLGDKQAQNECVLKGIVLPCPFCGWKKSKVRHACGDYFVECLKCHCTSSVISTKETVLKDWNTRQAPPIGPCRECAHIRYNEENDPYCSYENGLGDPYEWDFCSYFEPKCSEEK